MADISSHLAWAGHAINSSIISDSDARLELVQQHDRIRLRLTDSRLYVGFFGEFSSGKSTLLNSLLGARLLPTSALVTTSVATNLYPAESEHVSVTLRDGGETLRSGTDEFDAWYRLRAGQSGSGSVREVLSTIIRNDEISRHLDSIDLGVRGTLIGPDIVVVDTPGFNSTHLMHTEIAMSVAERVDLAVVLIPANSPGSMTLAEFITDVLAGLQDRCVFVLTKCRLIDADERDSLELFVRTWLSGLGFDAPLLLRADASDVAVAELDPAVPPMTDPEIAPPIAVAEAKRIAEMLEGLAADRRTLLMEASVAALLDALLLAIANASVLRSQKLEIRQKELDAVPITDLESFLAVWRRRVSTDMRKLVANLLKRQTGTLPVDALKKLCDSSVAAVETNDQITAIAATLTTETERVVKEWIDTCIRSIAKASGDALVRHSQRLADDFEEAYGNLSRLAGRGQKPPKFDHKPPAVSIPTLDLDTIFVPLRQKARELQGIAKMKSYGGAAAGATIGTAVVPGIGTVIGGFVGYLFGSGRGKQQAEFHAAIEKLHKHCLRMAQDLLHNSIPIVHAAIGVSTEGLCARYRDVVGPSVAVLQAEERLRRERVRQELQDAQSMMGEAQTRRTSLRNMRKQVELPFPIHGITAVRRDRRRET